MSASPSSSSAATSIVVPRGAGPTSGDSTSDALGATLLRDPTGVTAALGSDEADGPMPLTATTVKVYGCPFVSPSISQVVSTVEHDAPGGVDETS